MNTAPDWMTFDETTEGETDLLRRKFYPSEIQHLFDLGIVFHVPVALHVGMTDDAEPDRPLTRLLVEAIGERLQAKPWIDQSDNAQALFSGRVNITLGQVRKLVKEEWPE